MRLDNYHVDVVGHADRLVLSVGSKNPAGGAAGRSSGWPDALARTKSFMTHEEPLDDLGSEFGLKLAHSKSDGGSATFGFVAC